MRSMRDNDRARVVGAALAMAVGLTCANLTAKELGSEGLVAPAGNRSKTTPDLGAHLQLGIGDRLKVSFFEMIDLAGINPAEKAAGAPQGKMRTFYQRMDLSGEYTIGPDGAIAFPRLGRFQVEGRKLDDVQSELAGAFGAVMGRPADVSVMIVDRSPIYVVGPVKNPGSYKHVPGMIVLHAVALAGGLEQNNLPGTIEGIRETERLRKTADQVKRLLARRARLEAERDGIESVPVPVQLVALAGQESARAFLEPEMAVLRLEQARRRQQENEIAAGAAAALKELEALNRKLEQANLQKNIRMERLGDMQKLKDRGVMTSNSVILLQTELSDIEAQRQDQLVRVIQAEGRLAQAEQAKARLAWEHAGNLAKAIASVDQEIADAQESMASAGILAAILDRQGMGHMLDRSSQIQSTYEIVRQSKDGPKTLSASETSSLLPGDVLKIGVKSTAAAIPREVAPDAGAAPPAPTPEDRGRSASAVPTDWGRQVDRRAQKFIP